MGKSERWKINFFMLRRAPADMSIRVGCCLVAQFFLIKQPERVVRVSAETYTCYTYTCWEIYRSIIIYALQNLLLLFGLENFVGCSHVSPPVMLKMKLNKIINYSCSCIHNQNSLVQFFFISDFFFSIVSILNGLPPMIRI